MDCGAAELVSHLNQSYQRLTNDPLSLLAGHLLFLFSATIPYCSLHRDSIMSDLLTPLQTRSRLEVNRAQDQLVPIEAQQTKTPVFAIKSPEDALDALKSKPDYATLTRALRWLNLTATKADGFNIKKPGPKAAQIIFTLVNDIVPDYWDALSSDNGEEKTLLIQCISSVTGVGALTSRLRFSLGLLKDIPKPTQVNSTSRTQSVESVLMVLETVLEREDFITTVWHDISDLDLHLSQKSMQWKEFVSLVASGKVLSVASEANRTLSDMNANIRAGSWVGIGSQYAAWLGRCIQHTIKAVKDDDVEGQKALSQLLSKGLCLGYTGLCEIDTEKRH